MRKVIFIAFFSISICYGQIDSTRTNYSTDGGGVGYKVTASQLNGRSIDSLRFFKLTGGTDTNRRVMNVIYAQYGGVFGNGSDMTSRINAMYTKAYVSSVTFAYDTVTVITVSGTVNITKNTEIKGAVSFTGSGTINFNNNIVDADPNQVIFGTGLTVTNIRSKLGYIPAKWFGVVADGVTNDYTAISKAMASAPKWVSIGLPEGKTMIGSTLSITKSIIGLGNNKSSALIYNTSASGTDLKLASISADSVKLYNLTFDGSNKCATLVDFGNGYKGVEISHNTFYRVEQQGSETTNTSAIHLRNNNDGTWIHHNYITQINAKNNGVSRGIWGSTSNGTPQATSPKRCIIEYNEIDGVSNTGSGSLDSDQICWQDYTDSAGLIIRFNDHYNVYKRGVKCSSPGVLVIGERIWSSAYLIPQVTNSGISLYANQCAAIDNYIYDGRFEAGAIEVGVGDTSSISDIRVLGNYAKINSAAGGQTNRVGVKVYGTKNKLISIVGNRIYGGQIGIYLADGGRGYSIIGNEVYNTSDNAYLIASINSYPNNWHNDVQINNNKAFKCAQAVFSIGRINGGTFIGNTIDSCADDFILNYSPYIDSLLGVSAIGNAISPTGYGSGKLINSGTYARRLPLSNPNSLPGLQYVASDSSNATYLWQGGAYVKIGAAVGTGVTSVSAGNGMNFTTITGTGSVVLGTPSTLTTSTTNSSSGTTHTHALDLSGRTLTAGNGLTGGGTLGADRTFTLGTPSNITLSSTNSVTGTTHAHAFVPGGTAGQLIRGNGTLSTALSSTGYVKFNSGTNDYSTSSTVPYSDISGNKPTSGEYVADTLYTFPVLTSFTADTLIYTVIEDKVHVAGSFQVTTDGSGGYVIDIEFPPGLESYYTGFPGFIYGSGGALTVLGSNPLPVTIFGGGLNNPGGVRLTFTGGASTIYNVIFSFDYKIIPND